MNWERLSEAVKQRVDMEDDAGEFRFWASWYGGLQYLGGHENPVFGSDCSGTVCGPLWLMGYNIRCTADDLYTKLFTDVVLDYETRDEIMAVFYIALTAREHFGRVAPAGTVVHVTPVVGRYVVMNAFDPIQPMTAAYVRQWYTDADCRTEWRQLNWMKLKEHSEKRDLISGVDPILESIRSSREVYGG